MIVKWQQRVRQLKTDTIAVYLACKDPRTPWYAKAVAWCTVAYLLSPIDLIPDFIPVVGMLDDLILVPLGISLAVRMIPAPVLADCREQARAIAGRPVSHAVVAVVIVIVAIWLLAALLTIVLAVRLLSHVF